VGERLQRLTMSAFRGVPGEMTVEFGQGQSIVVYGENGTGKSTIADALEWYFTGQIELLTHEGRQHAVRNLKGAKGPVTAVEIETDGSLGGRLVFPDERDAEALEATGRETFLLRGRTLADFINKTKTEKWKALVEILRLDAIESLREDLQRARNELRKQVKAAEEQVQSSRQALASGEGSLSEEALLVNLQEICGLLGVDPPGSLAQVVDPQWLTKVAGVPAAPAGDRDHVLAEVARLETPAPESGPLEAWNALVSAERSRELPRASLIQEAKRLLGTTSIDGRCPLCGQTVDEKKLARRIEASLVSLLDATQELERCRDAVLQWSEGLRAAHQRRESLARRAKQAQIELPALPAFPRAALEGRLDTLAPIEAGATSDYQSRLRQWDLSAREICRKAAPAAATTRESQLMMLAAICGQIKTWRAAETKLAEATRAGELAEKVFEVYQERQKADVAALLSQISLRVARIYLALHPGEELGSVSIEPWTAKGVELAIDFYGSHQRPPHGVLSESHLNSLAIALILAMAETFNEKLRFLVLDDVINSFDREHRSQLADLLANEFADWQLVVLTHDHQFYEHLTRRAPSWKKLELTSWSYGEGPRTTGYDAGGILRAARELLERGDVGGAAGKARRALEEHLQEVCEALEAPLAFRRGQANERRDIGELFKGLRRTLKEHAKGLLDELEPSFKTLEADVGATLNTEVHASRGRSGSSEVEAAVKRIEELDRKWNCPACATRVWHRGGPQAGRCKCGKSAFPPVPAA
jgi:energy-coupling factor transporter ATP-binding protein EcfA2